MNIQYPTRNIQQKKEKEKKEKNWILAFAGMTGGPVPSIGIEIGIGIGIEIGFDFDSDTDTDFDTDRRVAWLDRGCLRGGHGWTENDE